MIIANSSKEFKEKQESFWFDGLRLELFHQATYGEIFFFFQTKRSFKIFINNYRNIIIFISGKIY